MAEDRKITLLRACYDLLQECDDGMYVKDAMSVTVFYDDAECDGKCLMDDIRLELEDAPQA